MKTAVIVIVLGAIIFCAHLFNGLFRYTKVPNALLFLLVGIVVGPILGIVRPEHFGEVGPIFTTVTLILLMFESGVNLQVGELVKSIGSAFLLTVFNFVVSACIATGVSYSMAGLDIMTASFFGVIVAGTSSAVVIPIIQQLKMNEKGSTTLLLESALSDVLCLVIGLALLASMKEGVFDMGSILNTVWKSFLLAALLGLVGGFIWSLFLHKLRLIKNSILTTPACVFIIYGISELMGWNGGIATLMFGIVLGNAYLLRNTFIGPILPDNELQGPEKMFFSELVFVLSTFFFVYVGVSIQFGSPWMYVLALIIVVGIIAARPLSVKLFVRTPMKLGELSVMSIMAPKGLVPAILASIPLQYGLAGGQEVQDLSYAVVLESILICAVLVIIISKDPLSIGYLKNILSGKATDLVEVQRESEEGDSMTKALGSDGKLGEASTEIEESGPEKPIN